MDPEIGSLTSCPKTGSCINYNIFQLHAITELLTVALNQYPVALHKWTTLASAWMSEGNPASTALVICVLALFTLESNMFNQDFARIRYNIFSDRNAKSASRYASYVSHVGFSMDVQGQPCLHRPWSHSDAIDLCVLSSVHSYQCFLTVHDLL